MNTTGSSIERPGVPVATPTIEHDLSLRELNSFGLPAVARTLARVTSEADVRRLLADPRCGAAPKLVLGGGSNLVFSRDPQAVVLKVEVMGRRLVAERPEARIVELGAGESWHEVVAWTLGQGWPGLENLALIPGTVGAAPVQNIGAYGLELADRFESLDAVDLVTGRTVTLDARACAFGYRDSIFKRGGAALPRDRYAITRVRFRLSRRFTPRLDYGDIRAELDARGVGTPTAQAVAEAVAAIRRRRLPDPAVQGNAGSFFKNPIVAADVAQALRERFGAMPQYPHGGDGREVKLSAAWLIEQVDWKGRGIHPDDAAAVSAQHALVLVNRGGATGGALWALAQAIQHDVAERFGVMLEPEPRIV